MTNFLALTPGNGLECERKDNLDKRSETVETTGCARASRNSIIRRYLQRRNPRLSEGRAQVDLTKKVAHTNMRSLVLEWHPEWFTRSRGKLRWQTGVSAEEQRSIVQAGNQDSISQYIAEHREELEAELDRRRQAAALQEALRQDFPILTKEWV